MLKISKHNRVNKLWNILQQKKNEALLELMTLLEQKREPDDFQVFQFILGFKSKTGLRYM